MFPSIPFFNLVSVPFKRAQLGLFHGKTKQFGNSVPNSKHKTRRSWLPNVHNHRLLSETLGQRLRIKVTTRALKTITKASAVRARIQSLSRYADVRGRVAVWRARQLLAQNEAGSARLGGDAFANDGARQAAEGAQGRAAAEGTS